MIPQIIPILSQINPVHATPISASELILTLILLMWTIWRAPTNVSKWGMGFNSAFKGLILYFHLRLGPPSFLLLSGLPEICKNFFSLPYVLTAPPRVDNMLDIVEY